jgi:hypothetical protein
MKQSRLRKYKKLLQVAAFIAVASSAWAASTCTGVNRNLSDKRKVVLAPAIARQLKAGHVNVLQSLQSGGWSIFYVETHETDNVYVFYSHDPLTSRYVTLWGGMADSDEGPTVKAWIFKHAPGIPRNLASCFAWHVTHE